MSFKLAVWLKFTEKLIIRTKKEIKSSDFGFALAKLPCNNTVSAFLML